MKKLLLTHSDLDGIGCAIIAQYFNYYDSHIYFADYSEVDNGVLLSPPYFTVKPLTMYDYLKSFDSIVITDLSISEETYRFLKESGKDFKILDHHDSSKFLPNDQGNIVLDQEKCGTRLLYEHLSINKRIPSVVKEFVDVVDAYDMWKKESPLWSMAEGFNGIFYQMRNYTARGYYKYADFIKMQLIKFRQWDHFGLTNIEKEYLEKDKEKKARNLAKAYQSIDYREDSKGKKFALIAIPASISYVADQILSTDQSLDYLVAINTYKAARGKISIRSQKDEFDCTTLSHSDGHKQASGGELTDEEINALLSGKTNDLGYK